MKIEFKNVTFSYENKEDTENEVIKDLSFKIYPGEMLAILGHNGSGKSTIAKLMIGLLSPNAGNIYLDDLDTSKLKEKELDSIHAKMGIIFQNPDNQFVGVTVEDDIAFGLENRKVPREEMIQKINHFAKIVEMDAFLKANPEQLSGGQKQRVAIAGVLAMDPEVIIFDESTSMLDPRGTKEVISMIKNLKNKENRTIITITHNLEEATLADRVIVLKEGSIVLDDKPEVVLKEKSLLEACGLKLLDSLSLMQELENEEFENKKEVLEKLWELTFEM